MTGSKTRKTKKSKKRVNNLAMFTLTLLAVFCLGLVYLSKHEQFVHTKKQLAKTEKKAKAKVKTADKPRFEFYSVLPNTNINVDKPISRSRSLDRGYVLQVASVKNYQDADRLKAKLILMGYDVSIAKINAKNGTYNRVNVGPYSSERAAELAKQRLVELKYQAVLRKIN